MSTSKRTRSPSPAPSDSKKSRTSTPVRFLILSDTHNAELPSNLPARTVLLNCGDLTEDGTPDAMSKVLASLGCIEAELKLVIAGNHEISMDKAYYVAERGSAEDVEKPLALISSNSSSMATKNGVMFLHEGTHTFTLASGASFTIYASPFTSAYGSSTLQYPSNEDRYNPASDTPAWAKNVGTERRRVPDHVDIVMTHGPAQYILDETSDGRSAGCEHLRRAIARTKPKLFCFGHVHRGYGAQRLEFGGKGDGIVPAVKERIGQNQAKEKVYASLPPGSVEKLSEGRQTLAVNAAIEGEKGVLENAPWLVELEL